MKEQPPKEFYEYVEKCWRQGEFCELIELMIYFRDELREEERSEEQ